MALVYCSERTKIPFHDATGLLDLPVRLSVECRGHPSPRGTQPSQMLPDVACEPAVPIGDYGAWEPVQPEVRVKEDFCEALGCESLLAGRYLVCTLDQCIDKGDDRVVTGVCG